MKMTKFKQFILFGLLCLTHSVFSQTEQVTGRVTDITGAPLPGANVLEKGTTNGVQTDFDGNFSLNVQNLNNVLIVSYIGFATQEVPLEGQSVVSVSLEESASGLDEVVVVGYGTQKRANLTGAVSTVSAEVIENRPITSAATALQGTTSGVFINQNSGQPGRDDVQIRIRGVGTLNNSSPLVLVDGIEGELNNINPDDIESLTVLKDAASAAIYGSRAANGVVLVTTKRGKRGDRATFNYSGYYGLTAATDLPNMVSDGAVFARLKNEALTNFGVAPEYSDEFIAQLEASGQNVNYLEELFNTSPIQQHTIGAAGGSERTNYRLSLGYLNQEGVVPKADFRRWNLRLNLDSDITDRFSVGTSTSIIYGRRRGTDDDIANGTGDQGIVSRAIRADPTINIRNGEGTLIRPLNRQNVFDYIATNDFERNQYDILANVYANYELFEGFNIKGTVALNALTFTDKKFESTVPAVDEDGNVRAEVAANRRLNRLAVNRMNVTTFIQATYDKSFGDHNFKFLGGYNKETSFQEGFGASRFGFSSNNIRVLNAGDPNPQNRGNFGDATEWALVSYFGRLNYNYDNRYLLEGNIRYDGTSRFLNDKWGVFPSFSLGWVVSEEKFFDVSFINFLKFRGSWGELGNQNTTSLSGGNFAYAEILGLDQNYPFGSQSRQGAALVSLGNPDLTWETTTTTNIGINMSLFDSKITLEADYFWRDTDDIIYDVPVNPLTGQSEITANTGKLKNEGWELGLGYRERLGDFSFGISGNVTFVENEFVEVFNPFRDEVIDELILGNRGILRKGSPINSYYGYGVDGIFRSQEEIDAAPDQSEVSPNYAVGDLRFTDHNGDGVVNPEDRKILGQQDPKWLYGWSFDMEYKGFDVQAIFQGAADFDGYVSAELGQPFSNNAGVSSAWLDRWTPDNPDGNFPRIYTGTGPSNPSDGFTSAFFLYDRSYLRLKNLQIGYSIPKEALKDSFISDIRVYVNGTNLFTVTDWPYFDPERPAGLQRGGSAFPNLRVISTGLNLTF